MGSIDALLDALDERTIAREIGLPHDEARMRYPLHSNTVSDFDQFSSTIADYYNHHFTECVSGGGALSSAEAGGRAKEIIERAYRRRGGNTTSAFNNAHDGTDGGMRAVLDIICEGIKAESVERYIRDMFDRHVAPNSWDDKVDIIRQFISRCGAQLSSSIRASQPEAYAQNFEELIRSYTNALQQTSAMFRRF
ncbi:hypothetical protein ACFL6U_02920 [Planctomycetota bacterium]